LKEKSTAGQKQGEESGSNSLNLSLFFANTTARKKDEGKPKIGPRASGFLKLHNQADIKNPKEKKLAPRLESIQTSINP